MIPGIKIEVVIKDGTSLRDGLAQCIDFARDNDITVVAKYQSFSRRVDGDTDIDDAQGDIVRQIELLERCKGWLVR